MKVVIQFLTTKQYSAAAIQRELCSGLSVMNEGVVSEWVYSFKGGRTNSHNEKDKSSRPPLLQGVLLVKFIKLGTIINKAVRYETLKNFKRAIKTNVVVC